MERSGILSDGSLVEWYLFMLSFLNPACGSLEDEEVPSIIRSLIICNLMLETIFFQLLDEFCVAGGSNQLNTIEP